MIGKIVSGISEKAKQGTQNDSMLQRLFFKGRINRKNENTCYKKQIKDDGCRPVYIFTQKTAELATIQIFGYKPKTNKIDNEKYNESKAISKY